LGEARGDPISKKGPVLWLLIKIQGLLRSATLGKSQGFGYGFS
jgi:hypothetical protein